MIARFTEGKDRHQLGFAEAVLREFAFLEARYGFRRTKESATFVRYESEHLFFNIFHGRGSYEIGVELGRLSNPTMHYRLPALIAALGPQYSGRTFFQASKRQVVENCVAEAARAIETYCGAALAGDEEALQKVEDAENAEGERLTVQAQFGAVIERADRAWEAKDRARAAELYAAAEPALNKAQRRRLEYLRQRSLVRPRRPHRRRPHRG